MTAERPAIILLSGGLDSATTAAIAKSKGFQPLALSFRYGQRHAIEIESAKRVAKSLGIAKHVVIDIDLRVFGGSALTAEIAVPKNSESSGIPITYVPARNTIFLSYALAFAEVERANDIFIGVNAVDYSGYPDCRPEFIRAFEQMANLSTKAAVEGNRLTVHAPLISLTKAEIIRKGASLGIDFSLTTSCYDPAPDGRACGTCDSCRIRKAGFAAAQIDDRTRYV
jgi:7-cyano-7-deazaguanine synthase